MPKGDSAVFYRFAEHGKMADGWKPATICYTRIRKTVPQYKKWKEEGESSELFRVGVGESSASAISTNNVSFATWSTAKHTIEKIWGSKSTSKKPWKSMLHNITSGKRSINLLFFLYKTQWLQICSLVHVILQTKIELFWVIPISPKKNIKTLNSCFWGYVKETMC